MNSRLRFPRAARLPVRASAVKNQELPPLRFGIYSPEGRLIRVGEVADPRNRICHTFNEMRALDSDNIARPLVEGTVSHA